MFQFQLFEQARNVFCLFEFEIIKVYIVYCEIVSNKIKYWHWQSKLLLIFQDTKVNLHTTDFGLWTLFGLLINLIWILFHVVQFAVGGGIYFQTNHKMPLNVTEK